MSETDSNPITQYKLQLAAVEESLKFAPDSEKASLLDLKEKLTEVIALLNESHNEKADTSNKDSQANSSLESIDDEFLRFQNEINALENSGNSSEGPKDIHEDVDDVHCELYKVLSSMEGEKCRAPFARQWGERAYHNAIIFSTDLEDQDVEDINNVQVKVMFCNPLCDEMKPCPFFLDGHCKFDANKCRFSHGNSVKYSDLEEYVLPDYSNVQRDSKCLAKFKDGLWYAAIVENCLVGNKYVVKYNTWGSTDTLAAYDILPIGDLNLSDDDDDSDSSSDGSFNGYSEETPKTSMSSEPVPGPSEINYVADVGSSAIGTWEKHTKGIASKLMAKMGYVWGQGLGKNSDGRIDPVEAIVFPKGKSLDKCAELRDLTGPVSVEDKFAAEQIKEEERVKKIEKKSEAENTVFDFLNKSIARSTDSSENISRKRPSSEANSVPDKKSNPDAELRLLNYEMYAIGQQRILAKKEVLRLQQSLSRNGTRNGVTSAHVKQQMAAQNNLLKRLEAKEQRISDEIKLKKERKKIATF